MSNSDRVRMSQTPDHLKFGQSTPVSVLLPHQTQTEHTCSRHFTLFECTFPGHLTLSNSDWADFLSRSRGPCSSTMFSSCTLHLSSACHHTQPHTHTHTHTHTQPHTMRTVHTAMHVCTHTHTHTEAHACTHIHTHAHTYTRMHTHTHACTHTHMHTHTCMHAYTHTLSLSLCGVCLPACVSH